MGARPGRPLVATLAGSALAILVARIAGVPPDALARLATAGLLLLAAAATVDYLGTRRAWRLAAPTVRRRLPSAFAIGVRRPVHVAISAAGRESWRFELFDHADPSLQTDGLPLHLHLDPGTTATASYVVLPTSRGEVTFAPAAVRVRSRWGLWDLLDRIGSPDVRRVYPDFAQVARYAWLAGNRRLQEIGVKTYQQRGRGTDFAQLSEYRVGDAVRDIDWKATLRADRPIVRQYQDERDQCVMLLIDCGRRMRPDDRPAGVGTTHFDQVLNAVMLLAHVALRQGDAVGAMTFGTPPGQARALAARKGAHTLQALMGQLFDIQPAVTHADYLAAARTLLARLRKRALIVLITNFRDEDAAELTQALRLLRSRHLVLVASTRERIVGELLEQPLAGAESALAVASAHLYEQARRDAFNRLAARDALMVDAEPARLGVELVNRYHAVKRAGLM